MNLVFLGDRDHQELQNKQVAYLRERGLEPTVLSWGLSDLSLLERLAELPAPLTLLASRHGSVPATLWTSRNPTRVRRLTLLHPSLHLGVAHQPIPAPHFVPTMVVINSQEFQPSADQIASVAGKFFHDYALHITPESAELKDTLSLLAFCGRLVTTCRRHDDVQTAQRHLASKGRRS